VEINALNGQQINSGCYCKHARYSGNVVSSLTVSDVFVDFDGPDNDIWTTSDNDLHLLLVSDPDGIAIGGKDATASDCGAVETPMACGGDAVDRSNTPRTIPWSVGAYEK
jgi:hypothetical protein